MGRAEHCRFRLGNPPVVRHPLQCCMGLSELLQLYSPELHAVQDRGGQTRQALARRKGCHAAVILQVMTSSKDQLSNHSRRTSFVNQVLFGHPSSPDSQIGVVAEQSHIKRVCLGHDLDLSNQQDIHQLVGQVEALPGCDVWAAIPDTHRSVPLQSRRRKRLMHQPSRNALDSVNKSRRYAWGLRKALSCQAPVRC